MKRKYAKYLTAWKDRSIRKPFLFKGARAFLLEQPAA